MKMNRNVAVVLWLILAAALTAQTLMFPADTVKSNSPNQAQLSALLRQPLPGRAAAKGAPSTYNPDTLYQYIDGGADIYLLYDFKTLLHQDFKTGTTDLTADIYQMGNTEDSFGIYSAERAPNYKYIPIGAEGYADKGILNFLAGQYYIKLSGSGPNADPLLNQFARLLSSRIGGSRALPSLLGGFPREHRVLHSEQYIKKDPLGHAFLAPAYVATYEQGRQQMKLVISVANDAAMAKARADQLARHFRQSGQEVPAPELGENGMRASNSFEGHVIARTRGRYLIALFNPAQDGAALLKTAAQSLP
jgi:hypothetical protein